MGILGELVGYLELYGHTSYGISPISGTHDLMRAMGGRNSTAWVWKEPWYG